MVKTINGINRLGNSLNSVTFVALSCLLLLSPYGAEAGQIPIEEATTIFHEPVARAHPQIPLRITLRTNSPEEMVHVRLFYRTVGEPDFQSVDFGRIPTGGFVVDIPRGDVRAPGLEYFIAGDSGRLRGYRFASRQDPYWIRVKEQNHDVERARLLAFYNERRARVSSGGSFVDYGVVPRLERVPGNPNANEYFYAIKMDFSYLVLTGPIRSLAFGVSRVRGESIMANELRNVGYDYGYAQTEIDLSEIFGLSFQLQLGANHEGFVVGGQSGIRIGPAYSTHVTAWSNSTTAVGTRSGFSLNWTTVPRLPMRAAIEVMNWPDNRDYALSLSYRVDISVGEAISIRPEVSYQARSSSFGRVGGGLALSYSF